MAASAGEQAATAERDGWDGMLVPDAQSLMSDVYVSLTAAAIATRTLKLGTGVTNPFTRHPAVAASAFSALQELSQHQPVRHRRPRRALHLTAARDPTTRRRPGRRSRARLHDRSTADRQSRGTARRGHASPAGNSAGFGGAGRRGSTMTYQLQRIYHRPSA
jgi:Luciferase-like monooxygenase